MMYGVIETTIFGDPIYLVHIFPDRIEPECLDRISKSALHKIFGIWYFRDKEDANEFLMNAILASEH